MPAQPVSLILADESADAEIAAADLVGQAEHGYNSPVWLVTNSRELAEQVIQIVPRLIDSLPEVNRVNAAAAWRDYAGSFSAKTGRDGSNFRRICSRAPNGSGQ